jgi:hypothetical protein
MIETMIEFTLNIKDAIEVVLKLVKPTTNIILTILTGD